MRGKWWVALLALIAFPVATALLTLVMEKRYTATMKLMIDQRVKGYDPGSSPFVVVDDVMSISGPRSTDTVVQIMTGSNVLVDAINRTAAKYPDAFTGNQASDKYETLQRRMSIENSAMSDAITVRVTMDNPDIAAEVANNIGYAYIDYVRNLENETGNAALALIDKQLSSTTARLAKVDDEIKKIKGEYGIADTQLAGQYTSQGQSLAESKLAELKGALDGARSELAVAQNSVATTKPTITASISTQYNPALQDLEVQLNREETNLSGLRQRYLDDHPAIIEQTTRIKNLTAQINKLKKTIEAGRNEASNPVYQQAILSIATTKAKIASLEGLVAEQERVLGSLNSKVGALPVVEQRITELMRQKVVMENSYAQLQQRKDIVESTGSGRKNTARIVSNAMPPGMPSFPDVRLFTLIGLAIGFVVAALIIMPKGDTDVYGSWQKADAKQLSAAKKKAVAQSAETPAIESGDPDPDA